MTALTIAADAPDAAARVAEVLRAGELVVLPTETVYGLAALPSVPGATDGLFERKGRGADVPVAVLCADAEQALALAEAPGPQARALAAAHWPGPLTMVLPRRADLGWALGEPSATIGLRCPDHGLVREVARLVGPIATTSANRHGQPTPPTASEAAAQLLGPVGLVVDGGRLGGTPSTVVECTGHEPRILRQGALEIL
ncbi:MAG TPA: L-threonylcarbamoyladenylate synthase [Acidimicrobiales bacterium]|nr:L-threonylcarbamoyladenylate synthase [Acidimicrobiales bacterium]